MVEQNYEPGTVAIATVRGVSCRVISDGMYWRTCFGIIAQGVTDIRPLVVLDVEALRGKMVAPPTVAELPQWLRTAADANKHGRDCLGSEAIRLLADQIEAQTKPPRIPEPGLYGVVEASTQHTKGRLKWVRINEKDWCSEDDNWSEPWGVLQGPVLIREGVS